MREATNTIRFCQTEMKGSVKKKYFAYIENDGYKENVFELIPSNGCKPALDWIANAIGDFSKDKSKSLEIWNRFQTALEKGELPTLEVQNGGQLESEKEIYKRLSEYIAECDKNIRKEVNLRMGVCKDKQTVFIAIELLTAVLQEITGESNVIETKKKLESFLELNGLFRGNTGRKDCVINCPKSEEGGKRCYRAWRFVRYKEEQPKPQPEPLREKAATERADQERRGA